MKARGSPVTVLATIAALTGAALRFAGPPCFSAATGSSAGPSSRAFPAHRQPLVLRAAATSNAEMVKLPEPPGPWAVPFLGAPRVLFALLTQVPLPELLKDLRAEYGKLFMFRAGPTCQVWVGDFQLLERIYNIPECSGRPVSFEDPFGNFLFLTREPEKAAPIREQQKAWLQANLRPEAIQEAMADAMQCIWPLVEDGSQTWPTTAVKRAMYSAVTSSFLGSEGLMSGAELEEFMQATKQYSEMRVKGKFGQKAGEGQELPPGAAKIRKIVGTALARAGREDADVALPLIVAASIGGAEIFPTLLHWIALSLAKDGKRQAVAVAAAAAGDNAALMKELYAVLRRVAYSVALGPPRKILADAQIDGMLLPEGAMLFAMHPAISDDALGRSAPENEDFGAFAFGVGPRACLGRPLAEALLPAAVGELLRKFRIEVEDPSVELKGELRGQLIHPLDPPPLRWIPRSS